jgi:hypothetical protein
MSPLFAREPTTAPLRHCAIQLAHSLGSVEPMETIVKRNTKRVGDIAESAVIAALIRNGYEVSIPFGENHRYDLIADREGVLSRMQIKSGRLRNGVVWFSACSSHAHRGGPPRSYRGEIGYFGIYCAETSGVYLISCAEAPAAMGSLRVSPTKQGQSKKVRWAHKYLLTENSPVLVGSASASVVETDSRNMQLLLPS